MAIRKVYNLGELPIAGMVRVRRQLVAQKKVWGALKKAGLPVADFFTVILRNPHGFHGLTVLTENLEKKYGKLIPINDRPGSPQPTFLRNLNFEKDGAVLTAMAEDLSRIINTGYAPRALDFWHFYKKADGSFGRVILDFGEINPIPQDQLNPKTGKPTASFQKSFKATVEAAIGLNMSTVERNKFINMLELFLNPPYAIQR